MADIKISALPNKLTLDGTEQVEINDAGTSKRANTGYIASLVTKTSIGLANVDNTSDAAKPISTATQAALDAKAGTSHTHTSSGITDFNAAVDARVAVVPGILRPSFAASFTPAPVAPASVISLTLTANITAFNAPSGTPVDGQVMTLHLWQDATTARTISGINAIYVNFPTISTTLGSCTTVSFVYDSTKAKWVG